LRAGRVGLKIGLKTLVERLEQQDSLPEQFLIVGMHTPQTLDQVANRRGFGRTEARVLQVDVVDNLADASDHGIGDTESLRQHLERAARTLVCEVAVVGIEGQGLLWRACIRSREREPSLRVDAFPNQPRGRHAIDARSRPRHPEATPKRPYIGDLTLRRCRCRAVVPPISRCQASLQSRQRRGGLVTARRSEEVDGPNVRETLLHHSGHALDPSPTRPAKECIRGHGFDGIRRRPNQLVVVGLSGHAKGLLQFVVGPGVHPVRGKDGGLPAERGDFGLHPGKVLLRRRRVRQRVDRAFHGDGAELLESPPDPHADVRGFRRQLVHQQQPRSV
jgi:hypothetical protein